MKENPTKSVLSVLNRCGVNPSLNIGVRNPKVNSSFNSNGTAVGEMTSGVNPYDYSGSPIHSTGVTPFTGVSGNVSVVGSSSNAFPNANASIYFPPKTAVEDFLKIQYTTVEVRCAITRKMVPAGSAVMLLGGMVISAEAFECWLEEHLAALIFRHQDVHTDTSGYNE